MFCRNCGNELGANDLFCQECGTRVEGTGTAPISPVDSSGHPGSAPDGQGGLEGQGAPVQPGGQNEPAQPAKQGARMPKWVVPVIAVAVVVVIAAIVAMVFFFGGNGKKSDTQAQPSSLITRVMPVDDEGKPLDDYELQLLDPNTGEILAKIDNAGADGVHLGDFRMNGAQIPNGLYGLAARDNKTGRVYSLPNVSVDDSNAGGTVTNKDTVGGGSESDSKQQPNPSPNSGNGASNSTGPIDTQEGEMSLQEKAYKAFLEKCEEYIDKYGEHTMDQANAKSEAKGLNLALLQDFDGDGLEELVVVYSDGKTKPDGSHYQRMEVWRYDEDSEAAQRVFEGTPLNGDGGYTVFQICTSSDSSKPSVIVQNELTGSTYPGETGQSVTTYNALKGSSFTPVDTAKLISSGGDTPEYEVNGSKVDGAHSSDLSKKYQTSPYTSRFYYFDSFMRESSRQGSSELIGYEECFSLTDSTIALLRRAAPGSKSPAASSGSAQLSQEAEKAYAAVLDDWKKCIAEDKLKTSSNGPTSWTYACSPSYVAEDSSKTGDAFVYAYVDLGIADDASLVVADPDDDYKVYGIYQYDRSISGDGIAKYTSHFRYYKYICEDGVLWSETRTTSTSENGREYNKVYAIQTAEPISGASQYTSLSFEDLKEIGCNAASSSDYYKITEDGKTEYKDSGLSAALGQWHAEYPQDDSIEWSKIL